MGKCLRTALKLLHIVSPTHGAIYRNYNAAIIVAAGNGTRMACSQTKQTMMLDAVPVVVRAMMPFQQSRAIREIVVVARQDEIGLYDQWKSIYGLTKLTKVVAGGATRQESCYLGFAALEDRADYVAIHDGARCLVTVPMIEDTLRCAYQYDCAASACHVSDTVKLCDANGTVESTPDRSRVWRAQTPQIFRADIYRAVSAMAREENIPVTDDCMLAEHYHFPVHMVDCGSSNIKITTSDDLYYARAILQMRADRKKEQEAEKA